MERIAEKVYCAFCKISRRAYRKKHINWTNILLSLLLAGVIMLAVWQRFDPRVSIIFVLNLFFAELFIQVRWRLAVVCPFCGFDPVLYLKDHNRAAEKVKKTLDRKRNSTELMLSEKNPFKNLPKASKNRAKKASTLSKQV